MKIPELLGFIVNYHASDNLDDLNRSVNHKPESGFVRFWNRVVQWIPFIGKKLMIGLVECQCNNKSLAQFDIKVMGDAKPHLMQVGETTEQVNDFHLLPIPHTQQTSPGGCGDACLDMLGCHFDCDHLKSCKIEIRSDGIRRMPDTGRSVGKSIDPDVFDDQIKSADLRKVSLPETSEAIKDALKSGPIVATVNVLWGLATHKVLIVGYHGDHVIINDPWSGGHQLKSMDRLFNDLCHKLPDRLAHITKEDVTSDETGSG